MGDAPLLFTHATVVLPGELLKNASVRVAGGRIRAIRVGTIKVQRGETEIDCRGKYLSPGFIDIHVHGGDGADFMDGTPDAVRTALRAHTRHGTTTIFPTTTTGSPAQIRAMLKACAAVQSEQAQQARADGARLAGVHFYGPYFAAEKTGCHTRSARRDPDPKEYRAALKGGLVRVATCAAELKGAEGFYRAAKKQRCLITCGHSNASWPEMERAFAAGMRHVDHFWCAMSSVPAVRARLGTPMRGSMAEFVLAHPEMSTEVIADGEHLAPELLEFAYRMKGPARLLLVTDASRALDMPPGRYRFGPNTTGEWLESNGRIGFQPGHGLASTVVGMDTMVRTMARVTSAGVVGAVRMASLTPAERTGLARQTGSIALGKRADLVVLSRDLRVQRVFIAGIEQRV
jgi:N-acetylglucosamine-6-phosphate deacetylase